MGLLEIRSVNKPVLAHAFRTGTGRYAPVRQAVGEQPVFAHNGRLELTFSKHRGSRPPTSQVRRQAACGDRGRVSRPSPAPPAFAGADVRHEVGFPIQLTFAGLTNSVSPDKREEKG